MGRLRRVVALALVLIAPAATADEEFFVTLSVPSPGRTLTADLADLDGDGRTDVMIIAADGLPPSEKRVARVHLQTAEGKLLGAPSFEVALPKGVGLYDLADVDGAPGRDLLAVQRDGLTILPLNGPDALPRKIPLPRGATVAAAADERGLERLPLAFDAFGPETWLLVPMIGELAILSPGGETVAMLEVGARANYLVPPSQSLYFLESDVQLFFDSPVISVGDVNGDGLADITATGRHAVRVFLRQPEGSFPHQPDRTIALGLIAEKDHVRGSGGVSVAPRDIDGDGRLDLLLSHVSGGFTDAKTRTSVHLNRNGSWDFAKPDRVFESDKSLGSDALLDLDGDGRFELVRGYIDIGVLEVVEFLVTRAVDAQISLYRFAPDTVFDEKPWARFKLGISVSFETFRTKGFLPSLRSDLNGDGFVDLITSGEGDRIDVALGKENRPYSKRDARQKLDSRGQLRTGDWNGDGLEDLLLFDPQHKGSEVRIIVNQGRLPGTPPSMRAAE